MNERLRAFALRGAGRDDALAFLHLHADVRGVLETDDELVVWLAAAPPPLDAFACAVEERAVRDEDFGHTGLEHDRAILVADDLLVRPPWVERPRDFTGVELVVPRGGAFGSGEDDSTRATLRALHRCWPDRAPASFADVGCGTGILALYAQHRGCARITACDIDPPSVAAAKELLPDADVRLGTAGALPPCELVVANMTGDELQAALPELLALWTGGAPLVLGGTREHQLDALAARVPAAVVHREPRGEFVATVFAQAR